MTTFPRCTFNIVFNDDDSILIEDMFEGMTITNDAERVVKHLHERGYLNGGKRLYYIDTEQELAEIVFADGEFKGFKSMGSVDNFRGEA